MPPSPPGGDDSPSTLLRVPTEYRLEQNYPNPFNPVTSITFVIPNHESGIMNHEFVSLKIFNLLGQEVATLVEGDREAGSYTVAWDAAHLPAGVYIYRLQAGSFNAMNKMILIR